MNKFTISIIICFFLCSCSSSLRVENIQLSQSQISKILNKTAENCHCTDKPTLITSCKELELPNEENERCVAVYFNKINPDTKKEIDQIYFCASFEIEDTYNTYPIMKLGDSWLYIYSGCPY